MALARILILSVVWFMMIYIRTASPQITTFDPTLEPTLPSLQPSSTPTSPSSNHSSNPSSHPSIPPTKMPSLSPHQTGLPTTQPTSNPTSNASTINPSLYVTLDPSKSPSQHTTATPTLSIPDPTNHPSSGIAKPTFVTYQNTTTNDMDDANNNNHKDSKTGTTIFVIGLCIFLFAVVVIMLVGYNRLKREDDIKQHPEKYTYDPSTSKFLKKPQKGNSNWLKSISINSSRSSPPRNNDVLPKQIEKENEMQKVVVDLKPPEKVASLAEVSDAEFAARLQFEEVELQFAEAIEAEKEYAIELAKAKEDNEVELQLAENRKPFAGEGKANMGEQDLVMDGGGDPDEIQAPAEEENPWNCPRCTFSNHPSLNHCEVCDEPKC